MKRCRLAPENLSRRKGKGRCGATGCEGSSFTGRTDIIYVEAISSADAKEGTTPPTLVPPDSSPGCFQTGRESTVDSPELNYFDQVMAQRLAAGITGADQMMQMIMAEEATRKHNPWQKGQGP